MRSRQTENGMVSGARLILICGLPGAGKTTLARRLAGELQAVRFCADEWMAALRVDVYDEGRRGAVEALQWSMAEELLAAGRTVIVEWGTWGRGERDRLRERARALGAAAELRYLEAPLEVLLERVTRRAAEVPPLTMADLRRDAGLLERPTEAEMRLYDAPLPDD